MRYSSVAVDHIGEVEVDSVPQHSSREHGDESVVGHHAGLGIDGIDQSLDG